MTVPSDGKVMATVFVLSRTKMRGLFGKGLYVQIITVIRPLGNQVAKK